MGWRGCSCYSIIEKRSLNTGFSPKPRLLTHKVSRGAPDTLGHTAVLLPHVLLSHSSPCPAAPCSPQIIHKPLAKQQCQHVTQPHISRRAKELGAGN